MEFCDKILEFRKSKKMNQIELAHMLNVSRSTVINWENGKVIPSKNTMKKIAKVMGINEAELIYDEEDFGTIDDITSKSEAMPEVKELTSKMVALFAGGTLSEKDKDAVMFTLQCAYLACKAKDSDNLEENNE